MTDFGIGGSLGIGGQAPPPKPKPKPKPKKKKIVGVGASGPIGGVAPPRRAPAWKKPPAPKMGEAKPGYDVSPMATREINFNTAYQNLFQRQPSPDKFNSFMEATLGMQDHSVQSFEEILQPLKEAELQHPDAKIDSDDFLSAPDSILTPGNFFNYLFSGRYKTMPPEEVPIPEKVGLRTNMGNLHYLEALRSKYRGKTLLELHGDEQAEFLAIAEEVQERTPDFASLYGNDRTNLVWDKNFDQRVGMLIYMHYIPYLVWKAQNNAESKSNEAAEIVEWATDGRIKSDDNIVSALSSAMMIEKQDERSGGIERTMYSWWVLGRPIGQTVRKARLNYIEEFGEDKLPPEERYKLQKERESTVGTVVSDILGALNPLALGEGQVQYPGGKGLAPGAIDTTEIQLSVEEEMKQRDKRINERQQEILMSAPSTVGGLRGLATQEEKEKALEQAKAEIAVLEKEKSYNVPEEDWKTIKLRSLVYDHTVATIHDVDEVLKGSDTFGPLDAYMWYNEITSRFIYSMRFVSEATGIIETFKNLPKQVMDALEEGIGGNLPDATPWAIKEYIDKGRLGDGLEDIRAGFQTFNDASVWAAGWKKSEGEWKKSGGMLMGSMALEAFGVDNPEDYEGALLAADLITTGLRDWGVGKAFQGTIFLSKLAGKPLMRGAYKALSDGKDYPIFMRTMAEILSQEVQHPTFVRVYLDIGGSIDEVDDIVKQLAALSPDTVKATDKAEELLRLLHDYGITPDPGAWAMFKGARAYKWLVGKGGREGNSRSMGITIYDGNGVPLDYADRSLYEFSLLFSGLRKREEIAAFAQRQSRAIYDARVGGDMEVKKVWDDFWTEIENNYKARPITASEYRELKRFNKGWKVPVENTTYWDFAESYMNYMKPSARAVKEGRAKLATKTEIDEINKARKEAGQPLITGGPIQHGRVYNSDFIRDYKTGEPVVGKDGRYLVIEQSYVSNEMLQQIAKEELEFAIKRKADLGPGASMEDKLLADNNIAKAESHIASIHDNATAQPFIETELLQTLYAPYNIRDLAKFNTGPFGRNVETRFNKIFDPLIAAQKQLVLATIGFPIRVVLSDEAMRLFFEGVAVGIIKHPKEFLKTLRMDKAQRRLLTGGSDLWLEGSRSQGYIPMSPGEPGYHKWLSGDVEDVGKSILGRIWKEQEDLYPGNPEAVEAGFRSEFDRLVKTTNPVDDDFIKAEELRLMLVKTNRADYHPERPPNSPERQALHEQIYEEVNELKRQQDIVVRKLSVFKRYSSKDATQAAIPSPVVTRPVTVVKSTRPPALTPVEVEQTQQAIELLKPEITKAKANGFTTESEIQDLVSKYEYDYRTWSEVYKTKKDGTIDIKASNKGIQKLLARRAQRLQSDLKPKYGYLKGVGDRFLGWSPSAIIVKDGKRYYRVYAGIRETTTIHKDFTRAQKLGSIREDGLKPLDVNKGDFQAIDGEEVYWVCTTDSGTALGYGSDMQGGVGLALQFDIPIEDVNRILRPGQLPLSETNYWNHGIVKGESISADYITAYARSAESVSPPTQAGVGGIKEISEEVNKSLWKPIKGTARKPRAVKTTGTVPVTSRLTVEENVVLKYPEKWEPTHFRKLAEDHGISWNAVNEGWTEGSVQAFKPAVVAKNIEGELYKKGVGPVKEPGPFWHEGKSFAPPAVEEVAPKFTTTAMDVVPPKDVKRMTAEYNALKANGVTYGAKTPQKRFMDAMEDTNATDYARAHEYYNMLNKMQKKNVDLIKTKEGKALSTESTRATTQYAKTTGEPLPSVDTFISDWINKTKFYSRHRATKDRFRGGGKITRGDISKLTPDELSELPPVRAQGPNYAWREKSWFKINEGPAKLFQWWNEFYTGRMLETFGGGVKKMLYAHKYNQTVDTMWDATKNGKILKNMDPKIQEGQIASQASSIATRYANANMYTNSRTVFQDLARDTVLFLPAYKQFLFYWAKVLVRQPFLMANMTRQMNGLQEWAREGWGPFNFFIPPIPFWAVGNAESMSDWVMNQMPGFSWPITLPLKAWNNYTGDLEDIAVGPLQFVSKRMSSIGWLDDLLYGATGKPIGGYIGIGKSADTRDAWKLNLARSLIADGKTPEDIDNLIYEMQNSSWWWRKVALEGGAGKFLSPGFVTITPKVGAADLARDYATFMYEYSRVRGNAKEEKKLLDKYPIGRVIQEFFDSKPEGRTEFLLDPANAQYIPFLVSKYDHTKEGVTRVGREYWSLFENDNIEYKDLDTYIEDILAFSQKVSFAEVNKKLLEDKKKTLAEGLIWAKETARKYADGDKKAYAAYMDAFRDPKYSGGFVKDKNIRNLAYYPWNMFPAEFKKYCPANVQQNYEVTVRALIENAKLRSGSVPGYVDTYSGEAKASFYWNQTPSKEDWIVIKKMEASLPPEMRANFMEGLGLTAKGEKMRKEIQAREDKFWLYVAGGEYWNLHAADLQEIGFKLQNPEKTEATLDYMNKRYNKYQSDLVGVTSMSDEYKAIRAAFQADIKAAMDEPWMTPIKGGIANRLLRSKLTRPEFKAADWSRDEVKPFVQDSINWAKDTTGTVDLNKTIIDAELWASSNYKYGYQQQELLRVAAWNSVLAIGKYIRGRLGSFYNEEMGSYGTSTASKEGKKWLAIYTRAVKAWAYSSPEFKREWNKMGGDYLLTDIIDYSN